MLVEDRVEELPPDQSVGEDEAGDAERTEEQTQLTELDHLWSGDWRVQSYTGQLLSVTQSLIVLLSQRTRANQPTGDVLGILF